MKPRARGSVRLDEVAGLGLREDGQVCISGPLLAYEQRLDSVFCAWADEARAVEHRFPGFIAARHLDRLGYFHSFPHLATFPVALADDEANLESFRSNGRPGGDGVVALSASAPVTHVVTPAACYHLYVAHEGGRFEAPPTWTTRCTCCRRERTYAALERQWTFQMREIVRAGPADDVHRFMEAHAARAIAFAEALELDVRWEGATDPFFRPAENPRYAFQKLDPVKRELVFDGRLAIASINDHRDHFGRAFDIQVGGGTCSTGCVAFGIERWLGALLHTHGPDASQWPSLADAARRGA